MLPPPQPSQLAILGSAFAAAAAAAAPPPLVTYQPTKRRRAADATGPPISGGPGGAAQESFAADFPPLPCKGACSAVIMPAEDARLCDVPSCSREWLVCRTCAPESADKRRLLCPAHQLGAAPQLPAPPSWHDAVSAPIGTLGRVFARLWARATGATTRDLEEWPAGEEPASEARVHPGLVLSAGILIDTMWTASRRAKVLGPARRFCVFLAHLGAVDAPFAELDRVAALYAERRVTAPLPTWALPQRKGPKGMCTVEPGTVATELSHLAEAVRLERLGAVPAYMGTLPQKYLALSGAFERAGHTRNYPVTPQMLWSLRDRCGDRWRKELNAALLQSLFALRAGTTQNITWRMLSPSLGGTALRWRRRHKRRQGNRVAPAPPVADALLPQFCIVAGQVIEAVLEYAHSINPDHGPDDPVLPVPPERITAMLRVFFPEIPPDFRLVAHGIRAGTATVLAAMGVPREVVQAWGWWAKEKGDPTDSHYAATCVNAMLAASRIMHRVVVRPVSPGFSELVSTGGPLPSSWTAPSDAALIPPPPAAPVVAPPDAESSSSEDECAPRAVAPRGRAGQQARFRPGQAAAVAGQVGAVVAVRRRR